MSSRNADVVYIIGADTEPFDESLGQLPAKAREAGGSIDGALNSAVRGLAVAGAAITASVTAPVVALGKKALETAIDFTTLYESTMIVFERMLGGADAARDLYDALLDVAKASTYSQETFLTAGKQLVGMGVSAEDTVRYIQAITDAVSAAGGTADDIIGLADVFGKLQATGRMTGDILNMMSDRGINALAILAYEAGVSTDQMRDMISEGALSSAEAMDMLVDGIENGYVDAAGHFVEGAEGMAAALKGGTLTGALDGVNTAIRTFSLALIGINPTLKETDEGYEESARRIEQLIEVISTVNEIIPKLATLFGGVTRAIGDFLTWLVGIPGPMEQGTQAANGMGGALDNLNRWLDQTDPSELEKVGNAIVAIAIAGPVLTAAAAGLKALQKAMAATRAASILLAKGVSGCQTAYLTFLYALDAAKAKMVADKAAKVGSAAASTTLTAAEGRLATAKAVLSTACQGAAAGLRAVGVAMYEAMGPVGIALLAITALVAAVRALVKADEEAAANRLTAAAEEQAAAVSRAEEAYNRAAAANGANSQEAIAAAENLRAERETFDELNMTVEEFGQKCQEDMKAQQELIDAGREGFDDLADATESYNELLEQNEQIDRDLAAAEQELSRCVAEDRQHTNRLTTARYSESDATAEARATVDELREAQEEGAKAAEEQAEMIEHLSNRSYEMRAAVQAVEDGTMSADEAIQHYGLSAEEAAELTEIEADAQQDLAIATSEAKDEMVKWVEETPGVRDALDGMGIGMDELAEAVEASGMSFEEFADLVEDCMSSAQTWVDTFAGAYIDDQGQIRYEDSLTAEQMISNLQTNQQAMQDYGSNVTTIMERTGQDSNSAFMQYIRSLGPDAAGEIQVLANMTDEELQQVVDLWYENGEASLEAAAAAAGMTVDEYTQAIQDGTVEADAATRALVGASTDPLSEDEIAARASDAGATIDTQFAAGIVNGQSEVAQAVNDLMLAVVNAVNEVSTAMQAAGGKIPEAIAQGITGGTGAITLAMLGVKLQVATAATSIDLTPDGQRIGMTFASGLAASLGAVRLSAMTLGVSLTSTLAAVNLAPVGTNTITGYAGGVLGGRNAVQLAANSVAGAVTGALGSANGQAWGIGFALCVGLTNGINAGRSMVVNAAISVSQSAINAARSTLGVASPSRVFREMGGYVMEGFAEGIGAGEQPVVSAIRSAMGAAIDTAAALGSELGDVLWDPSSYGIDFGAMAAASPANDSVAVSIASQARAERGDVSGILNSLLAAVEAGQVIEVDERELGRTVRKAVR